MCGLLKSFKILISLFTFSTRASSQIAFFDMIFIATSFLVISWNPNFTFENAPTPIVRSI